MTPYACDFGRENWSRCKAWWFDVTMHLLKNFPRLSQRRDASQGHL